MPARAPTEPDYHGELTPGERRRLVRNITGVSSVMGALLGTALGAGIGLLVGLLVAEAHDFQRRHHMPDPPDRRTTSRAWSRLSDPDL